MNVIILGAGEVGFNIAQKLASEGNDVAVIDNSKKRLQHVEDTMDVRCICGEATHPSVLQRAGAKNADILIAATLSDEANMLACQIAHSLFKVTTKMARIRQPDYVNHPELFGRDDLPIDLIISPEKEAAKSIVKRIQVSSAIDAQDFADGKLQLIGMNIPPKSPLAGLALNELIEVLGDDVHVYVVAHAHNNHWQIPRSDTVLLAGDSIYVAIANDHIDAFMTRIGNASTGKKQRKRHVMIIGGGHVGYIVAVELEKLGISVKIVEHNEMRALWLAEQLDCTIIHGDALDRALLEEESIDAIDDFLALTNDDETNSLVSLIAKSYKVPHIVTLVNQSVYSDLVRQIGLENTISPRLTTAAAILRHVRKGRIFGMSALGDGSLEVLEAEALKTSAIVGTPLRHLKLPKSAIIAAIIRGDDVIIPDGTSVIEPLDHVILVIQGDSLKEVEALFKVRLEFF